MRVKLFSQIGMSIVVLCYEYAFARVATSRRFRKRNQASASGDRWGFLAVRAFWPEAVFVSHIPKSPTGQAPPPPLWISNGTTTAWSDWQTPTIIRRLFPPLRDKYARAKSPHECLGLAIS